MISAAVQLYRSQQGTGLEVDRFPAWMVAMYAILLARHVALLTDRRWVWAPSWSPTR